MSTPTQKPEASSDRSSNTADPTSEASRKGEFEGGSTGEASRRNAEQSRAIGQADPIAERARHARESHRARPEYGAPDQTDWADKKTP